VSTVCLLWVYFYIVYCVSTLVVYYRMDLTVSGCSVCLLWLSTTVWVWHSLAVLCAYFGFLLLYVSDRLWLCPVTVSAVCLLWLSTTIWA
jgi:hypothetical protein